MSYLSAVFGEDMITIQIYLLFGLFYYSAAGKFPYGISPLYIIGGCGTAYILLISSIFPGDYPVTVITVVWCFVSGGINWLVVKQCIFNIGNKFP